MAKMKMSKKDQLKCLLDKLTKSDPIAQKIMLQSAHVFGIGIANMINILHPDKVILSSDLIDLFPYYYEKIIKTAERYVYRIGRESVQFSKGERKKSAVSIGATVLVYQAYLQ